MRLIDADALIGALHNHAFHEGDDRVIVYNVIQKQPTVDAVPVRHGAWIDEHCSECGKYVYHGDADNYCPHCGAKMDGGDTDGATP